MSQGTLPTDNNGLTAIVLEHERTLYVKQPSCLAEFSLSIVNNSRKNVKDILATLFIKEE